MLALLPAPPALAQQPPEPTDAATLYQEGLARYRQQAYAAAATALEAFLQADSREGLPTSRADWRLEAHYMLATIAYELRLPQATDALQGHLDTYPTTPHRSRTLALMATLSYLDGDYEGALSLYIQASLESLAADERDDMTYRMALCYLHTGDLQQAAVWLQTLRDVSPRYRADCTYHLAYVRYTQGQMDQALEGFLSLADDATYAPLVPGYIAEIHLVQGRYSEARQVANDYLARYPEGAEVAEMHRTLGTVSYQEADYLNAMQELQQYVDQQTEPQPRRDALYRLGLAQYACGVMTQVPQTLAPVTQGEDALAQNAWLHTGLAYLQMGDMNRARMTLGQAAASDADMAVKEQAAYDYALCLHATDYSAFGQGVTAFETFLNTFPSSPYADRASTYLVEVYMNTRSYEAALQSMDRIAQPSDAILEARQQVLLQLGIQAYTNTQWEQAADYLTQSLALGRFNAQTQAQAYYWRGETYYRMDQMDRADADLGALLARQADASREQVALAHYTRAYIDFNAGRYSAALAHLRDYLGVADATPREVLADAYCRMADCYLHDRQWDQATLYYTRAEDLHAGSGDYACYQRALVAGLQKDYATQVRLSDRLINDYPDSPYAVNALYEKGRAYVQTGQNAQAISTYRQLMTSYPESAVCRKAAAETGLLYYQQGDYDQAIAAYREVLTRYPGSDEARAATADLKSLYVETNRVDQLPALMASLPGAMAFEPSEQDSLTFAAAERVYMRQDLTEARQSLERYIQTFPQGAYTLEARHYLCLIAHQQGDDDALLTQTTALLEWPDSPYAPEALSLRAALYMSRQDPAAAQADYRRLVARAPSEDLRLEASMGCLRCAVALEDRPETIRTATALLAETKATADQCTEARYARAKAYLAESAADKALDDLRTLAQDTRTPQGAEAKYLVAQYLHDTGQDDQAESEAMDFIDRSTPHAYWLARSFILLADIYLAQGKTLEAREYLLSLRQNYQADDDIDSMIAQRLDAVNSEQ